MSFVCYTRSVYNFCFQLYLCTFVRGDRDFQDAGSFTSEYQLVFLLNGDDQDHIKGCFVMSRALGFWFCSIYIALIQNNNFSSYMDPFLSPLSNRRSSRDQSFQFFSDLRFTARILTDFLARYILFFSRDSESSATTLDDVTERTVRNYSNNNNRILWAFVQKTKVVTWKRSTAFRRKTECMQKYPK